MEVSRTIGLSAIALCLGIGTAYAGEDVRVAGEDEIATQWIQLTSNAPLGYPAEFADRGDNVCLAMGYAINNDGTTSDFSLLGSWNSATGDVEPVPGYWGAFAQAGANALSHWQFEPRPGVDVAGTTYTVATLGFQGGAPLAPEALREHCQVDIHALVAASWGDQQRSRRVAERERDRIIGASPIHRPRVDIRYEPAPQVAIDTGSSPRR